MVGAARIGDFAWAVENLLNRIIDGTRERSGAMLAALKDAIAVLPALVSEFEGKSGPVAGIDAIAARADSLAGGQPTSARARCSATCL